MAAVATLSDGSKHGSVVVAATGAHYEGALAADGVTPEGTGVLREAYGDVYRGALKGGKPHGWGEKRYRHGAVYAGQWLDGAAEGYGRYVDASGSTLHDGTWSKGVPAEYHLASSLTVLSAAAKFKKNLVFS